MILVKSLVRDEGSIAVGCGGLTVESAGGSLSGQYCAE